MHGHDCVCVECWQLLVSQTDQPQADRISPGARSRQTFEHFASRAAESVLSTTDRNSDPWAWLSFTHALIVSFLSVTCVNEIDLFMQALTVIEDSVTRRSRDLALLKLEKAEPDTSEAERSLPASSDISCKYYITDKINISE